MANYEAAARSNYFRVKDRLRFDAWAESRELEVIEDGELVGIHPVQPKESWPESIYNDATCEFEEVDVVGELAEHLLPDEVAVLVSVGYEKLRYLSGHAVALTSAGLLTTVNLDDIYEKAKQALGKPTHPITAAEY